MQGYIVSRPVAVRSGRQFKWVGPASSFDNPDVADVQIATMDELEAVAAQMKKNDPSIELRAEIKVFTQRQLAKWPQFPSALGRQGGNLRTGEQLLSSQLRALRARHPDRKHFRLMLANGFGKNLGDTLIGLAAFRSVTPLLREHLSQFTVDVMLGWHVGDAATNMFGKCDGFGTIYRQGPSLQALSRYQGFFDTTALITLPRYGEIAPVDWYLWWLGLDPDTVSPEDKRNSARLHEPDMAWVRAQLAPIPGKLFLLNPKASEPLRCMTPQATAALTDALLAQDPNNQVLFDQPVPITRPRVFHLADAIDTPGRLSALVAQVDGVITPDTFVQHIADAVNTPCCTLSASIPAEHFRYYPYGRTLELPGARALPAWGKTKLDPQQWTAAQDAYAEAWAQLSPREVLNSLAEAMVARQRSHCQTRSVTPPASTPVGGERSEATDRHGEGRVAPGQLPDPNGRQLRDLLLALGQQILACGDTVVLLGAGAGELALPLAARVAPTGWLIAFESRRRINQLLCANLACSGLANVQTHCAVPVGAGFNIVQQPVLAPEDDHLASDSGNQALSEPVPAWPLDAMGLNHCRLIVMQHPTPMLPAVAGAVGTLARLRPTLLAGGISREEILQWRAILAPHDYDIRIVTNAPLPNSQPDSDGATAQQGQILIAEPGEARSRTISGAKS